MVKISEEERVARIQYLKSSGWLEGKIGCETAKNGDELREAMENGVTDFFLTPVYYEYETARSEAYWHEIEDIKNADRSFEIECETIAEAIHTINALIDKYSDGTEEGITWFYFRVKCAEIPAEMTEMEQALRYRQELMGYLREGNKVPRRLW